MSDPSLCQCLDRTFILACQESTALLKHALAEENVPCEVLRQEAKPEYEGFSRSYRCLLNHRAAWERAAAASGQTLILESDFVPVVGFGDLPLPFDAQQADVGITWLYTCAPQVYSVSDEGYAQGFSTSMVAYIVNPRSAIALMELADAIAVDPGPENYSAWDSKVDEFLLARNMKNYIPFRNYGEHGGGNPNPEHRAFGLSATHRADVLYGKLAFPPAYTTYSPFTTVRLKARLKGLGRLLAGRYVRSHVLKGSSMPQRLLWFSIRRQFSAQI